RGLGVSFSGFLSIYLIAQTAAVLSHVPGGVGVFEAIVLALLAVPMQGGVASPAMSASLAASLLVYRIIYYLLPLCGAVALSAIAEVIRSRGSLISLDGGPGGRLQPNLAESDAV
nr:hypothetical protein [Gemmatimonadota bacterium]